MALLLTALPIVVATAATASSHKFVGYKKCKSCHKKEAIGNQYGWWVESSHAKAYETLASKKALEWAAKKGIDDPQHDDRCIKCHSTAHGVPDEMVSRKFDRTAGVQCESCHGAGKNYRKKKIMADLDKAVAAGLIVSDEKVCRECHNDDSPAWDPDRYDVAGGKSGFDFEQAVQAILHPVPEGYDPLGEGEAD